MTDLELSARIRAAMPAGPASDSLLASQPRPGEVVIQAHPSSNFVIAITPEVRALIEEALRGLVPGLAEVHYDPHH